MKWKANPIHFPAESSKANNTASNLFSLNDLSLERAKSWLDLCQMFALNSTRYLPRFCCANTFQILKIFNIILLETYSAHISIKINYFLNKIITYLYIY